MERESEGRRRLPTQSGDQISLSFSPLPPRPSPRPFPLRIYFVLRVARGLRTFHGFGEGYVGFGARAAHSWLCPWRGHRARGRRGPEGTRMLQRLRPGNFSSSILLLVGAIL